MKRIVSVVLAVLIIAVSFADSLPAVMAASEGKIEVENMTAKPGEEICIAVNVKNNPGIVSIALELTYDTSVLTLINVENGSVFSNSTATFGNNYHLVPYKMLWEDGLSPNNKKTDTLVYLTFKVSDTVRNPETSVSVSIDSDSTFNYNMENVRFAVSKSAVEIEQSAGEGNSFMKLIKSFIGRIVCFLDCLFNNRLSKVN